MTVLIVVLAALTIGLLITWGVAKAHWALVAMMAGLGAMVLLGVVKIVIFAASEFAAGSAKRMWKSQQ